MKWESWIDNDVLADDLEWHTVPDRELRLAEQRSIDAVILELLELPTRGDSRDLKIECARSRTIDRVLPSAGADRRSRLAPAAAVVACAFAVVGAVAGLAGVDERMPGPWLSSPSTPVAELQPSAVSTSPSTTSVPKPRPTAMGAEVASIAGPASRIRSAPVALWKGPR